MKSEQLKEKLLEKLVEYGDLLEKGVVKIGEQMPSVVEGFMTYRLQVEWFHVGFFGVLAAITGILSLISLLCYLAEWRGEWGPAAVIWGFIAICLIGMIGCQYLDVVHIQESPVTYLIEQVKRM